MVLIQAKSVDLSGEIVGASRARLQLLRQFALSLYRAEHTCGTEAQ